MKRVIRVFPRRTKATPDDEGARIGVGPGLFDEADEVHVSVAFTWDLPLAEKLAAEWKFVAPVQMGGPALGTRGEGFTPGFYVRRGYTITSRGCPNRCWFCSVWKREGGEVRFPKGRVKFAGADNSAPFPVAVVVFRPRVSSPNKEI